MIQKFNKKIKITSNSQELNNLKICNLMKVLLLLKIKIQLLKDLQVLETAKNIQNNKMEKTLDASLKAFQILILVKLNKI